MILQLLIVTVAGWLHRHQQQVITYLKEENRVIKSKLPNGRLRLNDTERRRLASLAYPLGRKQLKDTAIIATPDTLRRWYKRLVADTFNGSRKRHIGCLNAILAPRRAPRRAGCAPGKGLERRLQTPKDIHNMPYFNKSMGIISRAMEVDI